MTAAKKGIPAAYADVAVYTFDGIVVRIVIVAENINHLLQVDILSNQYSNRLILL